MSLSPVSGLRFTTLVVEIGPGEACLGRVLRLPSVRASVLTRLLLITDRAGIDAEPALNWRKQREKETTIGSGEEVVFPQFAVQVSFADSEDARGISAVSVGYLEDGLDLPALRLLQCQAGAF